MKNFGKSQALHAGLLKPKVMSSSQWMLIYKIVLKKLYNMITSQNFDLVSGWKEALIQWLQNLPSKLFNWAARKRLG
jgi:hypothetical protein